MKVKERFKAGARVKPVCELDKCTGTVTATRGALVAVKWDDGAPTSLWYRDDELESLEGDRCDVCGKDGATVRALAVGLCDDCAADHIREALLPLMGKVCASISRDASGNLQCCLTEYGVEHAHG
jgi:hypothetical protein